MTVITCLAVITYLSVNKQNYYCINDQLSKPFWLDGKPTPFRFLNVWTAKPGFLNVVKECWSTSATRSPLKVLSEKLHRTKQALRQWSRTSFGDIFSAVRMAEQNVVEVEIAHDEHPSDTLLTSLQEARVRLRHAFVVEEGFWG